MLLSVGIFTYSTRPRGSVVHAGYLAEALQAQGHEVTLYALSKAGDSFYRELSCGLRLLSARAAPSDPDELIRQRIAELVTAIDQEPLEHDIYHAEDCLAASGLLGAQRGIGRRPIVRTLHHLERFESAYLRECQRRSVLEADAVTCVSRVSQREVAAQLGRQCPVIGNGVRPNRFEARSPSLERALRQRRGVPPDARLVLSVGGVEPRKNSLRALEAMRSVLTANPDVRWLLAGGSSIWEHADYRMRFEQHLQTFPAEVRARVIQLGPVEEEELTSLYQMSDVLLCPSLQEGFGLCVLEALCARVAVVVPKGEPFSEYLDETAASFIEPESVPDIAHAVGELLGSSALRDARAQAGVTLAQRFSWERVAQQYADWYGALLAFRRA